MKFCCGIGRSRICSWVDARRLFIKQQMFARGGFLEGLSENEIQVQSDWFGFPPERKATRQDHIQLSSLFGRSCEIRRCIHVWDFEKVENRVVVLP